MSSKAKQGAGSAKPKKPSASGAESKSEDVLQAVVSKKLRQIAASGSSEDARAHNLRSRSLPTRSKIDSNHSHYRSQEYVVPRPPAPKLAA